MGHGHLDFNLFPNRFQESIFHPLTRLQIPALVIKPVAPWFLQRPNKELYLLLRLAGARRLISPLWAVRFAAGRPSGSVPRGLEGGGRRFSAGGGCGGRRRSLALLPLALLVLGQKSLPFKLHFPISENSINEECYKSRRFHRIVYFL